MKVTWPSTYQGFFLETTTNLNSSTWEFLRVTDAVPAWFNLDGPQRYIRLRDPECCD